MTRRHVLFDCEGSHLVGTVDEGCETTGLLIVTGGNELRAGAWAGQAGFAARIAAEGFPVFRFDRRGTGDSEGGNGGFRTSEPDIAAALATFRCAVPSLGRVVAMGNCDAASALMLSGGKGFDGLILSNPWTFEDDGQDSAPPEAVRDHYKRRLTDPAAIRRLLTGKVSIGKLFGSLGNAVKPAQPASSLSQEMAHRIADFSGGVVFPVAERDRTAQAFLANWKKNDPRIRRCPDASHSFVEPHARDWLAALVLETLRA
ncbi:MAG: hydrolase 1, exosortase A system-associated [Novosphingobium sp.]|nr:hydrolase 1, exosortase A system-associated [Novosphingobium sp.]